MGIITVIIFIYISFVKITNFQNKTMLTNKINQIKKNKLLKLLPLVLIITISSYTNLSISKKNSSGSAVAYYESNNKFNVFYQNTKELCNNVIQSVRNTNNIPIAVCILLRFIPESLFRKDQKPELSNDNVMYYSFALLTMVNVIIKVVIHKCIPLGIDATSAKAKANEAKAKANEAKAKANEAKAKASEAKTKASEAKTKIDKSQML